MKPKTVTIRGQKFRIVFRTNLGTLPCGTKKGGDCEEPKKGVREIRILKSLRGRDLIEVLLHELTHAAFWDLDDEVVTEFAKDVTDVLIGYVNEGTN